MPRAHDSAPVDVDVIVIGSGAGGLTAALALARAGHRVLVLEQHDVPGGWCHSFTLEGYGYSPGVHYIGELQPGGRLRRVYEGLGVGGDLTFFELNPDGYDHVIAGDQRFDIPKGRDRYREALKRRFPADAAGIDRYFAIVSGLARELDKLSSMRPTDMLLAPVKLPNLFRHGLRTLDSVLKRCVDDPFLRLILSVQAGDHGVAPERASMPLQAAIQDHYFNGGWYPKGGGMAIPRAFVRALKRHGAEVRTSTRVDRILLDGKRAVGVRLADGTDIRADQIISNADPGVTYGELIGRDALPWPLRRRLAKTRWSTGALSLFLAVDMDVRGAGFDSGNYWWNRTTDLNAAYALGTSPDARAVTGGLPAAFLTIPTLKDPTKARRHHTMEAFAFVNYQAFRRWAHTRCGDRPEDYQALKRELTASMLRDLEALVPGLRDHVVFSSLGTPLTNEHYVMATHGSIYGTDKGRRQIGPFAYPIKSPWAGLTLCGASTTSHGVMGATMSGLAAARHVSGLRTRDLLGEGGPSVTCLPAEDESAWPEAMRRRVADRRRRDGEAPAA
ncbi:MAG: phytoene dehydrogenase [Proteobacteria bacterium]|nr:MAG: phytoene dehydrogenase [Pseudomonadota bacterium]